MATEPRRPGRPRDARRVASVIEAAATCFCERGFEATSVDLVSERSGVSKVTIYSYFPSKRSLLQAAIADRIDREFSAIDWSEPDPAEPVATLTRIGAALLRLLRSPEAIGLQRALFGCLSLDSDVAEGIVRSGPQRLLETVAAYLRLANSRGSLLIPDAKRAADQFLSQFLGLAYIRVLLGLPPPSVEEDAELIRSNVSTFVRAFATLPVPADQVNSQV